MIIKHSTKGLSEKQWQDLRNSFIHQGKVGGSDTSTLLGLNEYKSPIVMFYQAVNFKASNTNYNEIMFHGKHLESYVADMWQYFDGTEEGLIMNHSTGNKINKATRVNAIIENTKYPFIFANIDRLISKHAVLGKKKGVLEIKTISSYASDKYISGIPPGYLIQLQTYMLILGLSYGEIAYLKDGRKLGIQTFEADKSIQDEVISKTKDFYSKVQQANAALELNKGATDDEKLLILAEYEPEVDSTDSYNDYITDRHKNKQNDKVIEGNQEQLSWAEEFQRWKTIEAEACETKKLYQNKLKRVLDINSANEITLGPGKKVKWNKMFLVNI